MFKQISTEDLEKRFKVSEYFDNGRQEYRWLQLHGLELPHKMFSRKIFENCSFTKCNFLQTDFSNSDFISCRFEDSETVRCDFSNTIFKRSVFKTSDSYSTFNNATIDGSWFQGHMYGSSFKGANFKESDLPPGLSNVNLSGVTGLLSPREFMNTNFQKDDKGYIVYKGFGRTDYPPKKEWKIEAGSYIEEVVSPTRQDSCGCGVNFATEHWVRNTYPSSQVWKCRIDFEDACSIVVPYGTDGKARCERLFLIQKV